MQQVDATQVKKGSLCEVFHGKDWWKCKVQATNVETNEILVHYVNGNKSDDEWVALASSRIRPSSQTSPAPQIRENLERSDIQLHEDTTKRTRTSLSQVCTKFRPFHHFVLV